jgi:DNA (cytosine-5)-methyltransferase 1
LADTERDGGRSDEPGRGPERGTADWRLGPWDNYTIVHCRDDKLRRISAEPGDEPLAARIPVKLGPEFAGLLGVAKDARRNRVGRLRGYGNAIVPQAAAEFVKAFMETEHATR